MLPGIGILNVQFLLQLIICFSNAGFNSAYGKLKTSIAVGRRPGGGNYLRRRRVVRGDTNQGGGVTRTRAVIKTEIIACNYYPTLRRISSRKIGKSCLINLVLFFNTINKPRYTKRVVLFFTKTLITYKY